jgi:hypothetical protein
MRPGRALRSGLVLAVTVMLSGSAGVSLAAAPAFKGNPKDGCWGTCGGVLGPQPVYMQLAGYKVISFVLAERCLGTYVAGGTTFDAEISLPQHGAKPLSISGGRVSFKGVVDILVNGNAGQRVSIDLVVRFSTATRAKGTLTVKYKTCKPFHFAARFTTP